MVEIAHHRIKKSELTMRLSLPRHFGARMAVAIWLIKLAGIVSPVTIEVTHD